MSITVELKVEMMCNGCVGAVKRVLEKMEGKGLNSNEVVRRLAPTKSCGALWRAASYIPH